MNDRELLDHFAAAALTGLVSTLTNEDAVEAAAAKMTPEAFRDTLADGAYLIAEAMMRRRNVYAIGPDNSTLARRSECGSAKGATAD